MDMIVTFPGNLRVDAHYKGFTIHTDQPAKDGGEGSAPTPFDLFLASLATCAGVYLLNFLRKRDIPTEGAGITMSPQRNPDTGMVSHITLTLNLPPEFPDKYREAVVNAVNLCSVKKHLLSPPEIEVVTTTASRAQPQPPQ